MSTAPETAAFVAMSSFSLPKLSEADTRELTLALAPRYWYVEDAVTVRADGSLAISEAIEGDLSDHLRRRSEDFTRQQLPWIEQFAKLDGLRVLEIGAGTGSWTVPLGLRGARVDAIDIEALAIEAGRKRCELYGLPNATFISLNATDIDQLAGEYDMVLFCASYEHMTHLERKVALRKAWDKLRPGGLLGLLECPNRLWYDDRHTTFSSFYNWLPDDLAIDYARFTKRPDFAKTFASEQSREAAGLALARWGRGVSYHDIEIVLGPISKLDVKPGLDDHQRQLRPDYDTWWRNSYESRYRDFLMSLEPSVAGAFFYPWVHVLIEKTANGER